MTPVLLVRIGGCIGALPVAEVVETFRPLPVQPLAGQPSFVLGVAVVRGTPAPVVDLGALVTGAPGTAARFVAVRVGDRRVVLAVDQVIGIQTLEAAQLRGLPPLVEAAGTRVDTLGALDGGLLMLLRSSHSLLEPALGALSGAPDPS